MSQDRVRLRLFLKHLHVLTQLWLDSQMSSTVTLYRSDAMVSVKRTRNELEHQHTVIWCFSVVIHLQFGVRSSLI